MSNQTKYQEQYNRLNRLYESFKEINDGKIHDKSSEFYQDVVYAFFMNCHHLKDWIKNDLAAASVKDNVENYINNNPDLRLCADICNGVKHLRRDSNRSGERPEFGKKKAKLYIESGPITIALKYEIKTDSGTIDAFDLATKYIKAWGIFIQSII